MKESGFCTICRATSPGGPGGKSGGGGVKILPMRWMPFSAAWRRLSSSFGKGVGGDLDVKGS